MMSLHVSDIGVMRKQTGCGQLCGSLYPAVTRDERSYRSAVGRCIANSPQGSRGKKNWKCTQRKSNRGCVYLCFIMKRRSSPHGLKQQSLCSKSWTSQRGESVIGSVSERRESFLCCNLLKRGKALKEQKAGLKGHDKTSDLPVQRYHLQ